MFHLKQIWTSWPCKHHRFAFHRFFIFWGLYYFFFLFHKKERETDVNPPPFYNICGPFISFSNPTFFPLFVLHHFGFSWYRFVCENGTLILGPCFYVLLLFPFSAKVSKPFQQLYISSRMNVSPFKNPQKKKRKRKIKRDKKISGPRCISMRQWCI